MPEDAGSIHRRHVTASPDVQATGRSEPPPAGRREPATNQPADGPPTASWAEVRPRPSPASSATPSRSSNRAASADDQTAAPSRRLPAISQPAGPAVIRATFTARGPPNNSNGAVVSVSDPSGNCRQVLVRGLPCAPPLFAPSSATRPSRQATEYSTCCRP
ncbi:hypothetical protein [Micromonospora inyonensis]|uniref:Uncharacterized protein n=1 Tax=Micromonospora inyonensis TaxID=47866 RepID=A0A1C6S3N7_9ACTN|nr:hypothetical protein [Micromonospora inyonensis]SCL23874.1 hypothetical protein GA0074694_3770 [Micromonospora inyonensis]